MNRSENLVIHQEPIKLLNPDCADSNAFFYQQRSQHVDGSVEKKKYKLNVEHEIKGFPTSIKPSDALLAVIGLVLSRYSMQHNVIINSSRIFNKQEESIIAIRLNVDSAVTSEKFMNHVVEQVASSLVSEERLSNIYFGTSKALAESDSYDLGIVLNSSETEVEIIYKTKYFEQSFIKRMSRHISKVASTFNSLHTATIGQIDIMDQDEIKYINDFNPQIINHPSVSVIELFEAQVLAAPDNKAIEYDGHILSYDELNVEANKLSHHLTDNLKIELGSTVGIMVDKSEKMIIGILAVLKSGGIYVPIDPAAPIERKKVIIEESELKVVITELEYITEINFFKGNFFTLDFQLDGLSTSESNPPLKTNAENLAYIIFTSGSTGKPKGVVVKHDSLVNLCYWHKREFSATSASRATLYANVSFDAAVWEMWPYLLIGASLYPLKEDQKLDLMSLAKFFEEKEITHCFLPTPICEEWSRQNISLSKNTVILTGGDRLRVENSNLNIVNNYGPTESTVVATSIKLTDNKHSPLVPIGSPIDNTKIYILDNDLRQVPIGVTGNIFILGRALASGYFRQPDLTNERFLKNPFNKQENEIMYATGDKGCWLEDGNILFAGRNDNQVKIHGYRIELGEIESCMIKHNIVVDAKVVAKEELNDDKILLGFYTASTEITNEELTEFLSSRLPDYMIPSRFIHVKEFGLTPNGKIDIASLLAYDEVLLPNSSEQEGLTDTQMKMVTIWKEVLNAPQVGLDDNFFSLGGDSIKAIRLTYEVNSTFDAALELMDVLKYDTPDLLLRQLMTGEVDDKVNALFQEVSLYMDEIKSDYLKSVDDEGMIEDVYPVADIQIGMIYHGLHDEEGVVYHDQIVHQVKYVDFDPTILRETLEIMTHKHEILRTRFDLENGIVPMQVVYKSNEPDYAHNDISSFEKETQEKTVKEFILTDRKQPFLVDKPGLWRVRTFDLGNDVIVIVLIFHHAIIDGWSDATFSTELNNIYQKLKNGIVYDATRLGCNYKDYIKEELIAKRNSATIEFWRNEFQNFNKTRFTFELNDNDSENKVYNLDLGSKIKNDLKRFAADQNVSPRVACFCVYLQVIKSLTLDQEITVGLHTHNRPLHKDSDKILGCFLNSIPVKYRSKSGVTWKEHLKAVNEKVMQLSEYNKLSLMEIVKLHPQSHQNSKGNSLFDSLYAFIDFHVYGDLDAKGEDFADTFTRQDVDVEGQGVNNTFFNFIVNSTLEEFNLVILYKSSQIDSSMIEYVGELFKTGLLTLINESGRLIDGNLQHLNENANSSSNKIDYNF